MGPLDCGSFFCALGFDPLGDPYILWLDTATTGWHHSSEQKEKVQGNQETELRRPPMDNLKNYGLTGYTASGFDAMESFIRAFRLCDHHQLCVGTLCRSGRHQSRPAKTRSRPVNSIKFKSLRDRATSGHESAMALTRNQSPMYDERTFEYASIPNRSWSTT